MAKAGAAKEIIDSNGALVASEDTAQVNGNDRAALLKANISRRPEGPRVFADWAHI